MLTKLTFAFIAALVLAQASAATKLADQHPFFYARTRARAFRLWLQVHLFSTAQVTYRQLLSRPNYCGLSARVHTLNEVSYHPPELTYAELRLYC